MQAMDRRGVLADAVRRRPGTKKTGTTLAFRCPRHSDSTASAWLGDHQWGCSACGFTEHFDSLAEILGVTLPEDTRRGLTLTEYADRKGLSLSALQSAGVHERTGKFGDTLVAIPYRDAEGTLLRTKLRTIKGTFWDKDGEGAPLYGQDVLAGAVVTAPVLIVEGESDCHAGWQRGLCVVGLPGASQWRSEYAPLLQGRTVYVWQEPDEGGATLVSAVAKDIPTARVIRDVSIDGTPVKDLCDLHQRVPDAEAFRTRWAELLAHATPIGAEGPSVIFDSISGDTLQHLLDEKLAPIDAVPTPLPLWNTLCHGGGGGVGLARGWFITIGANTGTGKSLMGLNLAHRAMLSGETVAFLSLEMGRSELATRFMAIASGSPVVELEQGPQFNAVTFDRARRQLDGIREMSGGHLLVNRRPLSKLADVVNSIRYYHEVHGARYFVVDYLQLIWTANTHSINDRVELVAHQLRDLTHSLNVTMIGLSQFNRQTSALRAERPVAQGLMGGSAIENDSHQVLLFDHSRFERQGTTANTWLIMDKNRHGGVSDIPVQWDYKSLRLLPRAPTVEEEERTHGRLTRYGRMS
jgi:KaiC/GvpD/RAD55 family RecA-like ATPase